MSLVYYGVTPSSCAQSNDCGSSAPCVPQPGECVYYSSTYLSGPNIQNGDNFNVVTQKLAAYITNLINNSGTITGAVNIGGGSGIYQSTVNNNLQLKTLVGGSNVLITPLSETIQISFDSQNSQDIAENVGFATEVFKEKAGNVFQFRTFNGQDLIFVTQVGDNVRVSYENKDKFNLNGDGVRSYVAGTFIEKIVVKPTATVSAFKVGSSSGNDDVVLEQPLAGGTHTTLVVEKYFESGVTLYIQGVNSPTTFLVFLEYSQP